MNEKVTVKNQFLRERYDKVTHSSGLSVYVFPKKLSTTYAALTVRFGSLDNRFRLEGEEEALAMPDGIAHFLEHKMFESEDNIDTFDKFAAVGASANAYTSNEVTSYLFSTSEAIEKALEILVDYVFHPYFTEKNVEKEVGIIGQEIKMYEDSPSSRLYMAMMECLYQNHEIRTNICGSYETISAITPELLTRCYRAFYRPDNMILTVCGDVTTDEVMRVVDAALPNDLPVSPAPICEYPEEPVGVFKKSCEFHMDIARPKICVGIKDTIIPKSPAERERRSIIMNLIGDLCFGESTPFYERLYNAGLISRDFSACYESVKGCAHMLFSAATDQPETLLAELRAEFARLSAATEIAETDFYRLRNVHYAEYIKDFDNTEEIAADLLDAILEGTELFETGNVISSVTPDEILSEMHRFFSEEQLSYAVILPINRRNSHA